jgi:NADPH-dependent 2,4-dienoyl-CoA reductase/sulfur reductase-like enzyme
VSQQQEPVRFSYQGRAMHARRGQTVAAALIEGGVPAWGATRRGARPRGIFCGIGHCHECLVDIGERAAVRACQAVLADGDDVRAPGPPGGTAPRPQADTAPPRATGTCFRADVAVVGAGPAGMAAALSAADAGCTVLLIDAAPQLGGQIYRQDRLLAPGAAAPEPVTGALPARFGRLAAHPRVRLLLEVTVWHAELADSGFRLYLSGAAAGSAETAAVVLAQGAAELVFPFPGWTLPGVVTAGAAQAMLKGQGVVVGRRVVVAGTGPLLLPVAVGLARHGARVLAVCEAAGGPALLPSAPRLARHPARAWEAGKYAAALARHRIRYRAGHAVIAADGTDRVARVTIAPVDRSWRTTGPPDVVTADTVAVGMGFTPSVDLARMLGCRDAAVPGRPAAAVAVGPDCAGSTSGVFACGEVTGIGGAQQAELEGRVAGAAAARHLGRLDDSGYRELTASSRRRLPASRHFAALLDGLYPLADGWLDRLQPDTVVCRCEDVTWAELASAFTVGATDLRAVKGLTRCGMGYCQGRVCGPVLQYLVARHCGRPLDGVGDLHTRNLADLVPLERLARGPG